MNQTLDPIETTNKFQALLRKPLSKDESDATVNEIEAIEGIHAALKLPSNTLLVYILDSTA